jgi:hypothetical protein
MDSITIYPKSEKQKTLLQSLFNEMSVRFELNKSLEESKFSEEEFIAKIDKSIQQAESGKTIKLDTETQKQLLGL